MKTLETDMRVRLMEAMWREIQDEAADAHPYGKFADAVLEELGWDDAVEIIQNQSDYGSTLSFKGESQDLNLVSSGNYRLIRVDDG